jgi:F0F1-type ATP synthase membrane subunit b/b'
LIRRAALALCLSLALASFAFPQESSPEPEGQAGRSEPEGDSMIWWKWANFAILAVGLGYLIGKNVPPLFRKQSDEIHQAMAEAAKIKQEAAAYAASVEARLANLQREIESLRQTAHSETMAEGARLRGDTDRHLQRIQEQSVQEIALMTRGAKAELRKYASELAIGLAEQRVRSRMTPEVQENLVSEFVTDLNRRTTPGMSN